MPFVKLLSKQVMLWSLCNIQDMHRTQQPQPVACKQFFHKWPLKSNGIALIDCSQRWLCQLGDSCFSELSSLFPVLFVPTRDACHMTPNSSIWLMVTTKRYLDDSLVLYFRLTIPQANNCPYSNCVLASNQHSSVTSPMSSLMAPRIEKMHNCFWINA